jgi:Phage integrase, N-terminal SAM-like domain
VLKEPAGDQEARQPLVVVVYAGRDPLTGRKRQKTGTAATKAEARQLEARLISQVGAGQHGGAAGKTVADLLEAWFQWRPSVRPISPNTLVNYRRYADQKLLPALGRLPLNRVDTATIDRFYAELRQRSSKCQHCYRRMRDGLPPMRRGEVFRLIFTGEERVHQTDCVQGIPMTASAIRDVHAVLSGAFKQAMVWGWISHNPVRLTTPPAVEQPDTRPPEVGQAERLIETAVAEDPELGLFLVLAVVLGARRGELCSLRWSDVDFDQGDVLVAGSVIILPGQPLLDRDVTKTGPSAGSRSAPARWSCCAPAGPSRSRWRSPPEPPSAPTPTSSAVRRTAPSPSAPTGCPIGSPSWPAGWESTVGCTTCATSWSRSSSRPASTCAPSPAGPGTATAAGQRSGPTRTSRPPRTGRRPS